MFNLLIEYNILIIYKSEHLLDPSSDPGLVLFRRDLFFQQLLEIRDREPNHFCLIWQTKDLENSGPTIVLNFLGCLQHEELLGIFRLRHNYNVYKTV